MSEPTAASPHLPLRHCYWVVPGLLLAGEHPGGATRDKTKDRLKKLLAAGIECFVDLTKPTELLRYDTHLPFYVEYARKAIKDHGLPGSRDQMIDILGYVENAMRAGRPVYVHCRAGIGRTGTVIGCLLVERGLSGDGALDELNRLWQQSKRSKSWAFVPETEAQTNYIREWKPSLKNGGFGMNSLASAVAAVGPMSAGGDPRPGVLTVADVQSRAARQATGAGQARAAMQNLAAGKGRTGTKTSGANHVAGAGLTAAAAQARAAAERGEGASQSAGAGFANGAGLSAAASKARASADRERAENKPRVADKHAAATGHGADVARGGRGAGAGAAPAGRQDLAKPPGSTPVADSPPSAVGRGPASPSAPMGRLDSAGGPASARVAGGAGAAPSAPTRRSDPTGVPTSARVAGNAGAAPLVAGRGPAAASSPAGRGDGPDPGDAPGFGGGAGLGAGARDHGGSALASGQRGDAPAISGGGRDRGGASGFEFGGGPDPGDDDPDRDWGALLRGDAGQGDRSRPRVGSASPAGSAPAVVPPREVIPPPAMIPSEPISPQAVFRAPAAGSVAAEPRADSDPLLDPTTLVAARALRERFVGTLLGLAVGDAVAAVTQFRRPGSFTPVGDMIGGGPFDLPRGAWSDDTAMALCLAESLLECNGFDPRDQVHRYGRWQQEGYLSCTGQCVGITASTARSLALAKWRRVVFPGSFDPELCDPEPLSRIASIALYYFASPETTLQQAAESSRITCQAPAVLDACRQLGGALHAALSGQPKARILAEITPVTEAALIANNTAASALGAALWAFSSTDNFRDAVLRAANVGGNSDVVASVCGQLAGAHYGMSAIPPSWRNSLMQKDLIEGYADRLLAHGLVSLSS